MEYFLNTVSSYRLKGIVKFTMPIISSYAWLKKNKPVKLDQMSSSVMHIFEWIFKKHGNNNSFVLNYWKIV